MSPRTYCRFGFRTEDRNDTGPNFRDGFPLEKTIRLAPPYQSSGNGGSAGGKTESGGGSEGGRDGGKAGDGGRNGGGVDKGGNIFCELKGRVALPAPEFEFKSELGPGKQVDLGMGDVAVSLDELNLLIHF